VGCGRIAAKSELMRVVAVRTAEPGPARAMHDPSGSMPGRGAYLCRGERPGEPNGDCLAVAMRRGGIGRTLRCPVAVPPEGLESVSR
jgi:predicted RNA-binding protein YlxR (DUF448 family)